MALLLLVLLLTAVALVPGRTECPHEAADLKSWSADDSWPGGEVPTGGDVTIDSPILLDVSTPEMDKITIASGGKLVLDPSTASLKLTANMVELTGGELWIGSEDCPYTGDAEVLLTGRRDESEGADSVQKAILVREGVLEVHGKPKRSWTRLAATVPKTTRQELIGNPIYSVGDNEDLSKAGFRMYEFDSVGNPVKYWGAVVGATRFNQVMTHTGNVVVIVISKFARFDEHDPEATAAVFETLCYGDSRESAMGDMTDGQRVAFAAICHIGSPDKGVELVGTIRDGRSQTGHLRQTIDQVEFAAISVVSLTGSADENLAEMASYTVGNVPSLERIVTMADSVSSWEIGDRVALASTDYHYKQAQEFELLDCPSCSDNQVKVNGPVWYTHWGEITDDVDMRGEVGLLTRNVRFHGQMENECYGGNLCDEFDYDTFGGQVKMLKDFTTARIENAEFFHMGQQAVLGSYPIHFHMCLETSSKDVYVRSNSIHHTFSRCVTLHGTHSVLVEDNIAFDHLGHCFFMEDGGEQNNRLVGNLGFGTKAGTLLPTDRISKVSTFWITNPDNELINNVAAGSDGIGIWILMPLFPTGPSADVDMGLVKGQTTRTPVKAFQGNVAHSNRNNGFRLDDELKSDGSVKSLRYKPLVDPTNPDSSFALLHLDDFVGYKNSEGVWIKSLWTLCTNFRLAENGVGMIFASSSPAERLPQNEMLRNSRVVGETANKGEPVGNVELQTGEIIELDRSIPRINSDLALIGFAFYRGPIHIVDTSFAGFKANALRPAGAIGKKFSNPYMLSPIASVRNVTFDFADPSEGTRFYDGDGTVTGFKEKDGNRQNVVIDWDGSLTTYPRANILRPLPTLLNARCVRVPNWGPGTALCPDRFSRIRVGKVGRIPTFVTRNDLMATETESAIAQMQISYSMNTLESYILHFNSTVPNKIQLVPFGLELGLAQKMAVCVGANQEVTVKPSTYTAAQTMDEVNADDSNSKYFYDAAVGVVNFRFTSPYPRGEDTTSQCPGVLDDDLNGECTLVVTISLPAANDDGDCRERAYPAYQTEPISAEGALTVPVFS